MIDPPTIEARDGELVPRSSTDIGDEYLPDSTDTKRFHGIATPVPKIVISDKGDFAGIRCPDTKSSTQYFSIQVALDMSAKEVPESFVTSFTYEVEVELTHGSLLS
jgi:hypothetical protein